MLKQLPSRNQRSKRFKVKHFLQICMLLAICIWLLYQAKNSHDKYKAYEGRSAKISKKVQSGHEVIKRGRKDLYIRGHNEKDEEMEEVEENKPEESDIDEERGLGDDDIDRHDQERAEEEEPEEVEDLTDEEDRESEEGSEKQQTEDKSNHIENASLLEEQAEGEKSNQVEMREEHYSNDDSSSAVQQKNEPTSTGLGIGVLRTVKEEAVEDAEVMELEDNKTDGTKEVIVDIEDSGLMVGGFWAAENGAPMQMMQ